MEIFLGVLLVQVVVVFLFWLFKPEKKSVYPDLPTCNNSHNPITSSKTFLLNRNPGHQSSYSSSGVSDFSGGYDVGCNYDSGCFGGVDSGGGDCGGVD